MTRADTRAPARGFTMVELLVVLGIITFLASVTVVAVWPFMEGRALSSGARTVQALIYQARSHAITNRSNATLYFNAAEGQMILFASQASLISALSDPDPQERANGFPTYRADRPEFLPKGTKFYRTPVGAFVVDTGGGPNGNALVFTRTGSVQGTENGAVSGNIIIRLQDPAAQTTKRIEVMFTSGFPRIYDE